MITTFDAYASRVTNMLDACHDADHLIDENRNALVLYCQQFAFAPEMPGPCASLLTCYDRHLPYRYNFPATYVPTHHAHHAHLDHNLHQGLNLNSGSTHGISLNVVGGNVPVDPSINPEIAAAAVS